jgi:D-aspartate ligase
MPAVILGAHVSALAALRLLSRRGIPCHVIDDTDNVITRSRWYRPTQPRLAESADADALATALRSMDLPAAVLIPCSDQWVSAVAGLPPELRERFPSAVPPAEAAATCVDKLRFSELTERLDVPRPRTMVIRNPSDRDAIPEDGVDTWFLKPTESQRHNRRFGTKGAFVTSRAEAAQHVQEATEAGITFLLQEWIPGDPDQTILLDGFVDRTGRIAAIDARRRVRMYPPRLANTCCAVTIPLAEVADAVETLRTVFKEMAFRGVFNVEFKFDARDGRHKIIEVNARPFWLIGHVAGAGLDLAHLAYLDAQGSPLPSARSYRLGRYGMYEFVDVKAIAHAWRHGRRPDGPVLRSWLMGDRALFWWRDPGPSLHGLRLAIGRVGRDRAVDPAP